MVEKKHPEVPGCLVRLTGDAVEDLETLFKADPQIVRWALKKMIQIERDPNAGAPLLGGLIGYRKIAVGDRDWRVVWRVVQTTQETSEWRSRKSGQLSLIHISEPTRPY